ncbi:Translation initiation factor IF-2 [Neolewinella maritima]|uniref:Translation initiation factor IF-2 n=1 Tax=Neolewinella maritima TaxID=1383882 RepID=A0ABM9B0L5_9BACT|nr:translation initiation factor IF-2 [Neolewinella maritima]CAH1000640.1 Translation initiation factor IF-2 [Neolewinella maritima]
MSKRLIKVAKELNVATSTLVEYLSGRGFDIENKPTAPVNGEMESALRQEFAKAISDKQKASKMEFGTRPTAAPVPPPPPPPPPVVRSATPAPPPPARPTGVPAPPPVQRPAQPVAKATPPADATPTPAKTEPAAAPAAPAPEKEADTPPTRDVPGLKVMGKIDLDATRRRPAKSAAKKPAPAPKPAAQRAPTEPAAPKAPAPQSAKPSAEPATAKAAAEPPTTEVKATTDKPDMHVTAEPKLRGLKVLGKIEIKKPEKRGASTTDDSRKKRKRKKITTGPPQTGGSRSGGGRNDRGRTGGRNDEPKEVSAKDIEDKIKATMARLQGGGKKKRQRQRRDNRDRIREKQEAMLDEQTTDKLQLTEFVTAQELANMMDVGIGEVITACMNAGVIVSINQRLDAEIIELVAEEFDHEVEFISVDETEEDEEEFFDAPEDLQSRPPIVTVMGHVDHGKTSLLDRIRDTNVIGGEAGGITQHIGAYEVTLANGKEITFLDTPGHEAFTAMRARGAKVTDIAIIIIAADDNVMPQTKEAISHAEAAGVPMIFAINKIDRPGSNPDRIKTELASMGYQVEEWGGKYQSQEISALAGTGIDELLEKVLLEAEMLELKANPDRAAVATVLEASLEKGRGYVTKILVQHGTLRVQDILVAGEASGRVRAMFNERNKRVKEVGPGTPVLLLGLDGAPQAGEIMKVMPSEQEARQLASRRAQISREQANRAAKRVSLDEIGRRLALGTFKELNLIVKGDVDGSVEALSDSLIKLSQETVQVNVIHKAVGQIIDSDILLATASDAIIVGFQVRPSSSARKLAEREGVEINTYSIIYEAIDEISSAIEGMLEPTREEKTTCQVSVREVFKISKVGTIAGCFVEEGKITRNTLIRVIRDGIVAFPLKEGQVGELASLKRFKDDVKEVRNGMECGLNIKNFNDIKEGDVIEGYEIVEIKQKMQSN